MNDPFKLSDLLGSAAQRFGVQDASAVATLWQRWAEVVGPEIAAHAEPTSLRDGVLKVRADSPVWATEIGYLADEIKAAIERELGPGSVRNVSVWTGPGKPRKPAPRDRGTPAREAAGRSSVKGPEPSLEEAFGRARKAWSERVSGRFRKRPENPENPR